MTVRMRVENPGTHQGKKTMAKRRKSRSTSRRRRTHARRAKHKHNPSTAMVVYGAPRKRARRTRRRSHAKRRTHRGRRFVASRGRGQRKKAKTYRVRNRHGKPLFHVRGWRARRKNPGSQGLMEAAVAVGAGVLASVAVSYVVDKFLSTQSATVQTGVLVAVAAAGAFLIPSATIAAGVATGLLLIPISQKVYAALPSLSNPAPAANTTTPAASTTPAATGTSGLGAIHRRIHNTHGRTFGSLHMGLLHLPQKRMGSLHMGSLHMGNVLGSSQAGINRVPSSRGLSQNAVLSRVFSR